MASFTICSAANAPYFEMVQDMVSSALGGTEVGTLSFSILDLGLEEKQQDWLKNHGATLAVPGWDIEFPGREETPDWFRAMTGRPMLRDYFPGHDTYMWIDADIWVQDTNCIQLYIDAATRFGAAITPEIDRSYRAMRGSNDILEMHHKAYRESFGEELASEMIRQPILNSGGFAMQADHEAWDKWAAVLAHGLSKGVTKHVEQAALNVTFYLPSTREPHFLPARCNWIVPQSIPRIDLQNGTLHESHMPFEKLGFIHLTGVSGPVPLKNVHDEESQKVDISYRGIRERFFSAQPSNGTA